MNSRKQTDAALEAKENLATDSLLRNAAETRFEGLKAFDSERGRMMTFFCSSFVPYHNFFTPHLILEHVILSEFLQCTARLLHQFLPCSFNVNVFAINE
jgi:hypothetical protein